ncbi:hypothetical protein BDW67DRAFT_170958 [Aspergillus spinulosporus]
MRALVITPFLLSGVLSIESCVGNAYRCEGDTFKPPLNDYVTETVCTKITAAKSCNCTTDHLLYCQYTGDPTLFESKCAEYNRKPHDKFQDNLDL